MWRQRLLAGLLSFYEPDKVDLLYCKILQRALHIGRDQRVLEPTNDEPVVRPVALHPEMLAAESFNPDCLALEGYEHLSADHISIPLAKTHYLYRPSRCCDRAIRTLSSTDCVPHAICHAEKDIQFAPFSIERARRGCSLHTFELHLTLRLVPVSEVEVAVKCGKICLVHFVFEHSGTESEELIRHALIVRIVRRVVGHRQRQRALVSGTSVVLRA